MKLTREIEYSNNLSDLFVYFIIFQLAVFITTQYSMTLFIRVMSLTSPFMLIVATYYGFLFKSQAVSHLWVASHTTAIIIEFLFARSLAFFLGINYWIFNTADNKFGRTNPRRLEDNTR